MVDLSKELLAAAAKFPKWQQDALRRLTLAKLEEKDFEELTKLAKAEARPAVAGDPVAVPIAAVHLTRTHSGGGPFSLIALHSVQGVNALEGNQRLDIAPAGLTAIFGGNGAGKSGYSRLLRKACRARKAPAILPNVKVPGLVIPPRAKFLVRGPAGEIDLDWTEKTPHDALASFAVFDRECERGIVDEKGEVAFVPPALGLFDELARAVVEVKKRIDEEETAARATDVLPDLLEKAAVSKPLAAIVAKTKADLADAVYESALKEIAALSWDPAREDKLAIARKRLLEAENPLAKTSALRGLANSVEGYAVLAAAAEKVLSDEAALAIREAGKRESALADAAAKEAAGFDFSLEPADSIGKEAWQVLYSAALGFAVGNMRGGPEFPASEGAAKCPLCLQDIGAEAKARFVRFRDYMNQQTKASAEAARRAHAQAITEIETMALPSLDKNVLEQAATEVGISPAALSGIGSALTARKTALLASAKSGDWDSLMMYAAQASVATTVAADLLRMATEAEKMADPVAVEAARKEAAELETAKLFFDQRERIEMVVNQQRKAASLKRVSNALGTRDISLAGKSLAEKAITGGLKQAFLEEMKALGADAIQVEISDVASKGKTTYGVSLTGPSASHKAGLVLSEGEQRVVALAYFLAEIRMAPEKVGIIIDDPVSSLDHWWAERIAFRLAQLGKDHQVVVFTHSIAFLIELERCSTETVTHLSKLFIERTSTGAGRCGPDAEPWEKLGVANRIKRFRVEIGLLCSEHEKSPTGREYAKRAAQLCGDIRAAWERAVEELIFYGTIERFGYKVSTMRLKGVVCSDSAHKTGNDAKTRLSAITSAHDKATGAFASCPSPTELELFVKNLEDFAKVQKDESKKASAVREPLESPPVIIPSASGPTVTVRKTA